MTMIEAVPEGWWYTARIPGDLRILSFHVDDDLAEDIKRRPELWLQSLQSTHHIKDKISSQPALEKLRFADASSSRLEQFAGDGWIACGDAAMAFDPLSSQGLFQALLSGKRAGQAVLSALMNLSHPTHSYQDWLENLWQHYIAQQRLHYGVVSRWPEEAFWSRRNLETIQETL